MVVLVSFYGIDLSDLIHRCVSVFVLLCVLVACLLDCVGGGGGVDFQVGNKEQRRHIKIQICFVVVDNISTFCQFDGFFIGRLACDAQYIYTLGIVFLLATGLRRNCLLFLSYLVLLCVCVLWTLPTFLTFALSRTAKRKSIWLCLVNFKGVYCVLC